MIEIASKEAAVSIKVLGLTTEQAGIPASSFVRVSAKDNSLHLSLGGDLSATTKLKGKGSVETKLLFVGRQEFLSFFQTTSKKPFQIEMSGKKLTVRQGRRKASLTGTADGVGYPEFDKLPSSGREISIRSDLVASLDAACSCSSGGPNTALHCIYLKDRNLLATDQILAFKEKLRKSVGEKHSFLLPMPVVSLLKAEDLEKLIIADGRVVLKFPSGLVSHPLPGRSVEFPSSSVESLLQGKTFYLKKEKVFSLPDSKKHVKKEKHWPEVFSLPVAALEEIIRRFSVYLSAVERLKAFVTVEVKKGDTQALFQARTQYAKFNEKVKIPKGAVDDFSVNLPVHLLPSFLKYWVENNKKGSVQAYCAKESPCLLVCGDSRLMVPSYAMEENKPNPAEPVEEE